MLGRSDESFQVSERIPFYEKQELQEWVASPRDNILCVAETGGFVVGFFYCKGMSYHWAMLDNFYVIPQQRDGHAGLVLLETLLARLRNRSISYLTTLVECERPQLGRLLQRYGFRRAKCCDWYELFLE